MGRNKKETLDEVSELNLDEKTLDEVSEVKFKSNFLRLKFSVNGSNYQFKEGLFSTKDYDVINYLNNLNIVQCLK